MAVQSLTYIKTKNSEELHYFTKELDALFFYLEKRLKNEFYKQFND